MTAKLLQLILLLCCLELDSLVAQNTNLLVLNSGFEKAYLDEVVTTYKDTSHTITIHQLVSGQHQGQLWEVGSPGHMLNMGYSRDSWWLNWTLLNNTPNTQNLSLLLGSGIISHAKLYTITDSLGRRVIDSMPTIGLAHPYQSSFHDSKGWNYNLQIPPGKSINYWLRINNEVASLRLNMILWNASKLRNHTNNYNIGWGVFFGILLLTILGSVAVFVATRQVVFFYYATYIASVILLNIVSLGLHLPVFQYEDHFMAHCYVFLSSALSIVAMLLFSKTYLDLNNWAPKLNYLIYFNFAVVFIMSILWFIWPEHWEISEWLIHIFTFLPLITLLIILGRVFFQKPIPQQHKLFLIAFSPLIILSVGIALRNNGIIGHTILFDFRMPVSFAFEAVVFSYALAIRIRDMRNERESLLERVNIQQRRSFRAVIEATEKERKRVAEDLHDGLGQLLSTAKLNLTAIEGVEDTEEYKNINTSIAILDEACQEVRHISHNMMPGTLIRLGLVSAVREQARKVNESGKILVTVTVSGFENRMDESREIAIYRVMQELLNNAIRYANATDIGIKLEQQADGYLFTISDNGQGFDPRLLEKSKGIGWRNIQSRIDLLQGNIDLKTAPGKGTIFNIWIP